MSALNLTVAVAGVLKVVSAFVFAEALEELAKAGLQSVYGASSGAGHLLFTSQCADFNTSGFGQSLNLLDAPSTCLGQIRSNDFVVRAKFPNIDVDQPSDQMGVFVGASADNLFPACAHDG